jgi:hypothetical protein
MAVAKKLVHSKVLQGSMDKTNGTAYFALTVIYTRKIFMISTTGDNVIKCFFSLSLSLQVKSCCVFP